MAGSQDRLTIKPSPVEIGVAVALAEPPAVDLSGIEVDDTVALYLKDMGSEPLLSHQEEIDLAKTIEAGREAKEQLEVIEDLSPKESFNLEFRVQVAEAARDRFIRANTRLVVSIAKRYCGNGVPFLDLIQEGNLSLMKAVEKFDYRKGNRFSTYATWWIRQAVARAVYNKSRTIRVSVAEIQRIEMIKRIADERESYSGRRPTPEELAEELEEISLEEMKLVFQASKEPVSLAKPVGEEEDSELGDFIADKRELLEEVAINGSLAEQLAEVLDTLDAREARILRLRFGLQDGHPYTRKEIGKKFGLNRERIRQMEQGALRRLRHPRRKRLLQDYWKS